MTGDIWHCSNYPYTQKYATLYKHETSDLGKTGIQRWITYVFGTEKWYPYVSTRYSTDPWSAALYPINVWDYWL